MIQAYVLVETSVGMASSVAGEILTLDEVIDADDVTGPYDVIARVELASRDLLDQIVSDVRKIEGVTRALGCPVVTH